MMMSIIAMRIANREARKEELTERLGETKINYHYIKRVLCSTILKSFLVTEFL